MIKLNLGCGHNRLPPPFINVDYAHHCNPDVVMNIEWQNWRWDDGSVDEIVANHVLEHCADLSAVMIEAHRVLIPGGLFRIAVPHPWSDGFLGDPTHVRPITGNTLSLYSKARCAEFKAKGWPNTPLADYLDVDFEMVEQKVKVFEKWKGLSLPSLEHYAAHYVNIIDELSFVLRRV